MLAIPTGTEIKYNSGSATTANKNLNTRMNCPIWCIMQVNFIWKINILLKITHKKLVSSLLMTGIIQLVHNFCLTVQCPFLLKLRIRICYMTTYTSQLKVKTWWLVISDSTLQHIAETGFVIESTWLCTEDQYPEM